MLYMLLLFYISSLLGLLVLFIGIPITILILVFDFYGLRWFPLLVLIVSMEFLRRTLLQCDRLYCFPSWETPLLHDDSTWCDVGFS